MIQGRTRDQYAAIPGIIRPAERECRERTINLTALHGAAEDQVVVAPSMIGTSAARLQCAAEVGLR